MRTRKIPFVEQILSDNSVALVKTELEIELLPEEAQRLVSISRRRGEGFILA
jgi:hypothetical protein